MTELFINVLGMTVAMSIVILLTYLFSITVGRRFSSKCRFALWTIIIIRLCLPIGMLSLTPVFSIDIPSQIVLHDDVAESIEDEVVPAETYDVIEVTPNDNSSSVIVEPEESLPISGIILEQPPLDIIVPNQLPISALVVLSVFPDKDNLPSLEIALPHGAVLPLNVEPVTVKTASLYA